MPVLVREHLGCRASQASLEGTLLSREKLEGNSPSSPEVTLPLHHSRQIGSQQRRKCTHGEPSPHIP